MASTQCPTCGEPVAHASQWVVVVERDEAAGEQRTRLIANRRLVIHLCTQTEPPKNEEAESN